MPGPLPGWKVYQAEDTVYECGEFLAGPLYSSDMYLSCHWTLAKAGLEPQGFLKNPKHQGQLVALGKAVAQSQGAIQGRSLR